MVVLIKAIFHFCYKLLFSCVWSVSFRVLEQEKKKKKTLNKGTHKPRKHIIIVFFIFFLKGAKLKIKMTQDLETNKRAFRHKI